MFTEEQKQELKKLIPEILALQPWRISRPTQFMPNVVKRESIEDKVIVVGLAADRPTSDSTGVGAYFSTDTNIFSVYDGSEWVEFARIPASPTAFTQTYSTADATHAASTFAAVAETASTQTTPWGFASQAQADAISVELNDLGDDVVDLKQLVNSLIDALQSIGLVS